MDLFVVNRHLDTETSTTETNEKEKLNAILSRIDTRRKRRQKRDEKRVLKKKYKEQHIADRVLAKELKIVKVPDQIESIDAVNEDSTEKRQKTKRKVPPGTEIEGFTILGGEDFNKKAKVIRVLPHWLSKPTVISTDLQNLKTKVSSLKDLDKELRNKLKQENIKHFFPVQASIIPYLLKANKLKNCVRPNDICVSAPTGSGKTLAFVLPIVQSLRNNVVKKVRALVILPTHDLATQVHKSFKYYAQGTNLDVVLVTGTAQFAHEQMQLVTKVAAFGYVSRADILVSTAGRLVDHLKSTPGFSLEHLEFLVIDEADRVLENVQNDWLYHLEKHIYNEEKYDAKMLNLDSLKTKKSPQKLLFSATLSQDPEKLQKLGLFQPKLFTSVIEGVENDNENVSDHFIGKYTTPKELTEKYIISSMQLKPLVLYEFIRKEQLTKTLVFTHSLESTHRLRVLLSALFKDSLKIEEIGSKIDAQFREKLIKRFTQGDIDILICTDSLARGIDLPGTLCVINYSAPKHLKTYIHRVGRTARAGEQGLAVTILTQTQLGQFQGFINYCGKSGVEEVKIDEEMLESLSREYSDALESLKETVQSEGKEKMKKFTSAKRLAWKRKQNKH